MLLLCLAGCATTGERLLSWRVPLPVREKTLRDATQSSAELAEGAAAASSNQPSGAPTPPQTNPSNVKPADSTLAAASSTAPTVSAGVSATSQADVVRDHPSPSASSPVTETARHYSAETLQLIERELRDASPEERAQWFQHLKQVDPALVPQILRARRLSLEMARQSQQFSSPRSAASDLGHSTPADTLSSASVTLDSTETGAPAKNQLRTTAHQLATDVSAERQRPASREINLRDTHTDPLASAVELEPIAVQRKRDDLSATSGSSAEADPSTAASASQTRPWPTPRSSSSKASASSAPNRLSLVQNVAQRLPTRQTSAVAPATDSQNHDDWQAALQQTIAALEQSLAAQPPRDPARTTLSEQEKEWHVTLRLLYLLAGQQERALTAIPGLDAAEQEFWQQTFWGIITALDDEHLPRSEDRAAQTVQQFQTAIRRLQEKADLVIRHLAFSRQSLGYGSYERFPRDEFRPGHDVLLYAEIENFKSELTADGQYRTVLRSTIEILSPTGEVRRRFDFPPTEDLCQNYRRDYFHNYQFAIPERLPLGPHLLKLTVYDELSGKTASTSIPFVVN